MFYDFVLGGMECVVVCLVNVWVNEVYGVMIFVGLDVGLLCVFVG